MQHPNLLGAEKEVEKEAESEAAGAPPAKTAKKKK